MGEKESTNKQLYISYTTSYPNKFVNLFWLKHYLSNSTKFESMSETFGDSFYSAFKTKGDTNALFEWLLKNKMNSITGNFTEKGIYLQLGQPMAAKLTFNDVDSHNYSVNLEGELLTILWVDPEAIIVTNIFVIDKDSSFSWEKVAELQHQRHMHMSFGDKVDVSKQFNWSNIQGNSQSPGPITDLTIESYVKYIFNAFSNWYCKWWAFRAKHAKEKSLRQYERNFRAVTMCTISIGVDRLDHADISEYVPMMLEGYHSFTVKNSDKFVADRDLSDTKKTILAMNERAILAIAERHLITDESSIRDQPLDFLGFGILAAEISTYLKLSQHEHVELLSSSRKFWKKYAINRLTSLISFNSLITDPAFIQTPLLRKMVKRLMILNDYDTMTKSIKGNIEVILNRKDQSSLVRLTIMLFIASIANLGALLVPMFHTISSIEAEITLGATIFLLLLITVLPSRIGRRRM